MLFAHEVLPHLLWDIPGFYVSMVSHLLLPCKKLQFNADPLNKIYFLFFVLIHLTTVSETINKPLLSLCKSIKFFPTHTSLFLLRVQCNYIKAKVFHSFMFVFVSDFP